MKKLFLTAIVITSLFACKQNTETRSEFDLVNAKKEIEATNQNLKELLAKGDSIGFANSYTADAKFMESNQPSIVGKSKIQSFWTKLINGGATNISLTTLEVWGDENYITEEGLYDFKSKDGAALGNGKYIVLWKKEDGKWKLHRDMANSDMPSTTK